MVIESQHYGLHPQDIEFVLDQLARGKAGIIPTDTVYAFCCLSDQKSGYEAICKIKHIDPKDALMSMICKDLSQASDFFTQWDTPVYRMLHKNLPGPFTFILNAGHRAPSFLRNKRKTLGLRIPEHKVVHAVTHGLTQPLMVSSVVQDNDLEPYFTDVELMIKQFEKQVGFIILDHDMMQEGSTVVDMTGAEPEIIRQGRGELEG